MKLSCQSLNNGGHWAPLKLYMHLPLKDHRTLHCHDDHSTRICIVIHIYLSRHVFVLS